MSGWGSPMPGPMGGRGLPLGRLLPLGGGFPHAEDTCQWLSVTLDRDVVKYIPVHPLSLFMTPQGILPDRSTENRSEVTE